MKTTKNLVLMTAVTTALLSFGSFAQSVSVTASTVDNAEAKIAALAHQTNSHYQITGTSSNNQVRMTANIDSAFQQGGLKN